MTSLLAALVFLATQSGENPGEQFTRFAGYDLGKATLLEFQDRYGRSRVRERGDAGEYEAWICYATPTGEVQFNSGEIGNGTDLLGFTLSKKLTGSDCQKPKVALPNNISGLALGASKIDFTAFAKNSVAWAKDVETTKFEYRTKTADGVPLDVSITVIATFRSDKLIELVVWKIETT